MSITGNSYSLSTLMLIISILLFPCCGGRQAIPTLPSESELAPDRLIIFVHGYMNDYSTMEGMVDVFTRQGVYFENSTEPTPVHGHAFDFGIFTKAGAGHNQSMDDLVDNFSHFYRSLPDKCPICSRRARNPVEVTIIAHSMGGIVVRDFLLSESLRKDTGEHDWEIARIVTTGTPYFGSSMTRFTQGLLSVVVNGLVRTVLMGFVNPRSGGAYGNTLDPQARALRKGSPYLWDSHIRWSRYMEESGDEIPPWLHVIAIGAARGQGDGVVKFPSTNIAPLLLEGSVETFLVNIRHGNMIRINIKNRGRKSYEQSALIEAIAEFIDKGSLSKSESFERTQVNESLSFYHQSSDTEDRKKEANLNRKLSRLERVVKADIADIWLRFYEITDPLEPDLSSAVLLEAPPSFFRTGIERSPYWPDISVTPELSRDNEMIPVVSSLDFQRSQLISIPDISPTGPYRLLVRLSHNIILGSEHMSIIAEGSEQLPFVSDGLPGIPLHIEPLQANLYHVLLDGEAIRREYPKLDNLIIREAALISEKRFKAKKQ